MSVKQLSPGHLSIARQQLLTWAKTGLLSLAKAHPWPVQFTSRWLTLHICSIQMRRNSLIQHEAKQQLKHTAVSLTVFQKEENTLHHVPFSYNHLYFCLYISFLFEYLYLLMFFFFYCAFGTICCGCYLTPFLISLIIKWVGRESKNISVSINSIAPTLVLLNVTGITCSVPKAGHFE